MERPTRQRTQRKMAPRLLPLSASGNLRLVPRQLPVSCAMSLSLVAKGSMVRRQTVRIHVRTAAIARPPTFPCSQCIFFAGVGVFGRLNLQVRPQGTRAVQGPGAQHNSVHTRTYTRFLPAIALVSLSLSPPQPPTPPAPFAPQHLWSRST
jgi:hypothetical protein